MLALLLTLVSFGSPRFEARTVAGQSHRGALTSLTDKQVGLQTAAGRIELPIDQLASLAAQPATALAEQPLAWVELIDGSVLSVRSLAVVNRQARVVLVGGRALSLPAGVVATARFQAATPPLDSEWARILDARPDGDLLVILKGDLLDYYKGVLGDISDSEVQFEADGERLAVKRTKLAGLVYYHPAGQKLGDVVCRITDSGGSRWAVQKLHFDGKLHWTTASGIQSQAELTELAKADFASDRVVYLSDLKAESSQWTPFFRPDKPLPLLERYYRVRQDRSFESTPLRLAGEEYRKGIAVHSRTEVVYRLPDRFRRLKAIVGIDDRVHPRGCVHLVIRGDERVLFESDVAGSDAPRALDLDLSGVRRLSILVDFARELNVGDHLLLCDARLIR